MGKRYYIECKCDEWKYIEVVDAALHFTYGQSAAPKGKMEMFKYCPYCGKKLKKIEHK